MRSSIVAIAFIALMASSAVARQVSTKPFNEQTQSAAHMKRVVLETLSQAHKSDGKICIFCTLIMGLTFQRSLQTGQNPGQVWKGLCSGSQNPVGKLICNILYDVLELYQIDKMDPKTSPETTCQNIGFCAKPAECVLFKKWPPQSAHANPALNERLMATRLQSILRGERDYPDYNFWQDFYNLLQFVGSNAKAHIKEVFDQHIPLPSDDLDSDHFATLQTLRGANWRGRDCNDSDSSIYPGRDVSAYGPSIDHNCNGIYGSDSAGISYEDKFCADSDSRGVVILGDSASAHFSFPPAIFTPSQTFNDSTWDGFLHIIMDEADWPQCSWSTGFLGQDDCPLTYTANGIQSIYSMMRDRNRCNHRDFANIGVNGARSGSMAPPNGTIASWSRDQTNDKPALVFYAPIGNDVCSSHSDPDHMTTPEDFRTNAMAALQYLDTQLPAKSFVVFMPLADGRLLYEILHNRTHPIGIPYPDLYDYLGCMQSSPCLGWMNTNATIRNQTQQRADELSAVYVDIMANETFNNFEMALLPSSLLDEAVAKWVAQGGDPADFIEPVDGFHPSQTGNSLIAQYVYDWLNTNYPDALGTINPNNDEIQAIFGNQGGY